MEKKIINVLTIFFISQKVMSKLFLIGFLTSILRALVSIFQYNVYSHQLQKKKCLQRIIIYVNYKLHTIKFAQILNSVVSLKKKKKLYIHFSAFEN